jgi:hypothetical protein
MSPPGVSSRAFFTLLLMPSVSVLKLKRIFEIELIEIEERANVLDECNLCALVVMEKTGGWDRDEPL